MLFLLYAGSILISMDNVSLCADANGTVQLESAWILDDCCRQAAADPGCRSAYDTCTHYPGELTIMSLYPHNYLSSIFSPTGDLLMACTWHRGISKYILTLCDSIKTGSTNPGTIILLI
jgi:hypothetical protein